MDASIGLDISLQSILFSDWGKYPQLVESDTKEATANPYQRIVQISCKKDSSKQSATNGVAVIVCPPQSSRFKLEGPDDMASPLMVYLERDLTVSYVLTFSPPGNGDRDYLWDNFADNIHFYTRDGKVTVSLVAVKAGSSANADSLAPLPTHQTQAAARPSVRLFEYIEEQHRVRAIRGENEAALESETKTSREVLHSSRSDFDELESKHLKSDIKPKKLAFVGVDTLAEAKLVISELRSRHKSVKSNVEGKAPEQDVVTTVPNAMALSDFNDLIKACKCLPLTAEDKELEFYKELINSVPPAAQPEKSTSSTATSQRRKVARPKGQGNARKDPTVKSEESGAAPTSPTLRFVDEDSSDEDVNTHTATHYDTVNITLEEKAFYDQLISGVSSHAAIPTNMEAISIPTSKLGSPGGETRRLDSSVSATRNTDRKATTHRSDAVSIKQQHARGPSSKAKVEKRQSECVITQGEPKQEKNGNAQIAKAVDKHSDEKTGNPSLAVLKQQEKRSRSSDMSNEISNNQNEVPLASLYEDEDVDPEGLTLPRRSNISKLHSESGAEANNKYSFIPKNPGDGPEESWMEEQLSQMMAADAGETFITASKMQKNSRTIGPKVRGGKV